jgi:hypothetical protein
MRDFWSMILLTAICGNFCCAMLDAKIYLLEDLVLVIIPARYWSVVPN